MTHEPSPGGAVVLLKPPGMTSHDVVDLARRRLTRIRVGHTGTLDPLAAGVLVLLVGRATRAARWFLALDKVYRAEALFGVTTTTGDLDGEVVARAPAADLDPGRARAAAADLTGWIVQRPPAASAVKVAGERAYVRARRGEAVTIPPRRVRVDRFELAAWRPDVVPGPRALFDITCSSGTYVRSLIDELGRRVGVPAVTSFLLRTRVGPFGLADAVTIEEFSAAPDPLGRLVPLAEALGFLPALTVDATVAKAVAHGRVLRAADLAPPDSPGPLRLLDPEGRLLAVARLEAGRLRYEAVFAAPGETR